MSKYQSVPKNLVIENNTVITILYQQIVLSLIYSLVNTVVIHSATNFNLIM